MPKPAVSQPLSLAAPGSPAPHPYSDLALTTPPTKRSKVPGAGGVRGRVASGLSLLDLPEAIVQKIYGFIPELVANHRQLNRKLHCLLLRAERIKLSVNRHRVSEVTPDTLSSFSGAVEVTGRHCRGLIETLSNALNGGWTSLVSLDLGFNAAGDSQAKELAGGLGCCTNMERLCLGDNELGPEGVAAIGKSLPSWRGLRRLDLQHNILTAPGMYYLAMGLKECPLLEDLNLANCHVLDEGATALAASLEGAKQLKVLDIGSNCMTSVGTKEVLRQCKGLTRLMLDGNYFMHPTDGHMTSPGLVLEYLGELRDLVHLTMFNCGIGPDIHRVAEVICRLPKLKRLNLAWNSLSSAYSSQLPSSTLISKLIQLPALEFVDLAGNRLEEADQHTCAGLLHDHDRFLLVSFN